MSNPLLIAHREAMVAAREKRLAEREAHHLTRERNANSGFRSLTQANLDPSRNYEADWFTYVFGPVSVAGTASVALTPIQLMQDSAFELMQLNITSILHGGTAPYLRTALTPVTIYMQDGGTSRYLMQNPVPAPLICGDGQLPFILPTERIFKPKSTISCTLAGYTSDTYDQVTLALIGRKLFDFVE